MLIIDPKTPTALQYVHTSVGATKIATILIRQSVSFYVEPYPDDGWVFYVNAEEGAKRALEQAIWEYESQ